MSDFVLARNCCLARMLPREAENGVGMNRSVRDVHYLEAHTDVCPRRLSSVPVQGVPR